MDLLPVADIVLIGLTFVLGVLGTLWEEPPKPAKVALIILLIGSSGAAAWKSISDEREKEASRTIAIENFVLPNSGYDEVYERLDQAFGPGAFSNCHHTIDG